MSNFLQDGLETPALSGFDVTFFLKKAVIYNVKSSLLKSFCRFLVTSCLYPILKQRQINGFKHRFTYLYNVSHSAHTSVAGWLGGQVVQINAKVIIEKRCFR
ncbi:hypothetical protein A0J48_010140 [Sphaerospermopsis aphanizomenoides BCCUSP55]|uniref:hypothetical protein n=1 Tax=Sphaerospermopsis aphanizomenoides TaxID=459663 RepID=UPI001905C868|nr:hypothetical protein [Sphaerospermopsis aphanizomenoides]MBK1987894.1 hypothetical protein [Sphaerospermopsis aphanizomenoides BCCUSP55]